jgi:hypothetical protein
MVQQPQPQPMMVQAPVQRPAGFIQFGPGAISPMAGFFIAFFLPVFGCAYNRQWTKQLVFLALFFTFGANAISDNPTYGNWGISLFWALSVIDTTLNSIALSAGYAITHTTFFAIPYSKDPNLVAYFQQVHRWVKPALIAVVVFTSLGILAMVSTPAIEKRNREAKFQAIGQQGYATYYKNQIRGGESTGEIQSLIGFPNESQRDFNNGKWAYWFKGESLEIYFENGRVVSANVAGYSPIKN